MKPILAGYYRGAPYLCIGAASAQREDRTWAFGAKELMRMPAPGDKIGHAEIQIGDSHVMLADEFPEMGFLSPQSVGGSPVMMHLYVEDVDATANKAVAAGAKVTKPVADQFYGDRSGQIRDPFGHNWYVSTHKEDVTPDEIDARRAKLFGGA